MKQNKIIAVYNDNGNVGKSTLTNFGIFPRLKNNPEIIYSEAESGNTILGEIKETAHGPVKHFEATQEDFNEMIRYLMENVVSHDIVVDFGSTDSALMRALFIESPGAVDVFDLWLLPTSPDVKQSDRLRTAKFLQLQDVPPEKIRLIFTILPSSKKIKKVFDEIYKEHADEPFFVLDESAVLYKTKLIDELADTGYSIEDLLNDKTDWKQKVIDAHPHRADPEVANKIKQYTWMNLCTKQAQSINDDFDAIFKSIMS